MGHAREPIGDLSGADTSESLRESPERVPRRSARPSDTTGRGVLMARAVLDLGDERCREVETLADDGD